jgi:hypothetical protein
VPTLLLDPAKAKAVLPARKVAAKAANLISLNMFFSLGLSASP